VYTNNMTEALRTPLCIPPRPWHSIATADFRCAYFFTNTPVGLTQPRGVSRYRELRASRGAIVMISIARLSFCLSDIDIVRHANE